MKEQLISFETAKLAKEKGFDSKYTEDYDTLGVVQQRGILESHNLERVSAPTQSLLQKWLRETHRINVESNWMPNFQIYKCLFTPMDVKPKDLNTKQFVGYSYKHTLPNTYKTYEDALEAGLQEALKMIK